MEATPSQDLRVPLAHQRTDFAKYRTQLALDRTTLAWLRTALTFATFGFGMVGFFRAILQTANTPESARLHQAAIHLGVALILIGVIGLLFAAAAHLFALAKLRRGDPLPLSTWPLTVTISVLVSILGLYGLWSVLHG
jgi:putative membrane protein